MIIKNFKFSEGGIAIGRGMIDSLMIDKTNNFW